MTSAGFAYLQKNRHNTVTMNGEDYRVVINEVLIPKFNAADLHDVWFQQDGITIFACKFFPGRLINIPFWRFVTVNQMRRFGHPKFLLLGLPEGLGVHE